MKNKIGKIFPLVAILGIGVLLQNWPRVDLMLDPIATQHLNERDVTLYSTTWCGYCRKVRKFFELADVPYREFDIEKDPVAHRRYEQLGLVGVPVIRIGNLTIQGFDRAEIRSALDELTQPRLID